MLTANRVAHKHLVFSVNFKVMLILKKTESQEKWLRAIFLSPSHCYFLQFMTELTDKKLILVVNKLKMPSNFVLYGLNQEQSCCYFTLWKSLELLFQYR